MLLRVVTMGCVVVLRCVVMLRQVVMLLCVVLFCVVVRIWIIATFKQALTCVRRRASQMSLKRVSSNQTLTDDPALGYNSSDYESSDGNDDEQSPRKHPKKAGAKKSANLPVYHLCNYPKPNGKYCAKQMITTTEAVCNSHYTDAMRDIPEAVNVMKTARAKFLCVGTTGAPRSNEAKLHITNLYLSYRKCLTAMFNAKTSGQGLVIEGRAYTWEFIGLFDDAFNLGVAVAPEGQALYDKLVALRRAFIRQKMAELQEELAMLEAEFRNYASNTELETLLAEGAKLRGAGASTSAAADPPSLEMEDAPVGGQDYADSD